MIIKSAGISSSTPALVGTLSDSYRKSPLGNDLIQGRIVGGVVGGGIASGVAGFTTYAIRQKWLTLKGKKGKVYLNNLLLNISTIMWDLMRYYFTNTLPTKPAVVMASIPLGTITEVSHAMSQRDLKFRATGGVFLADQEGGSESLRIVGKAWCKNRFVFLNMLDTLFLYGSAKTIDLFTDFLKDPMSQIPLIGDDPSSPTLGGVRNLDKSVVPWKEFNADANNEGIGDFRLTFPVITRARIYSNMFIETYDYTEAVEHGIDVVEYTIFLRKYIPPPPQKFDRVLEKDGSNFATKWYYKTEVDDEFYNFIDKMDLIIGQGFSTAMIMYRTMVYLATNKFSYMENLVSRFGIALNRTIEGNVDINTAYSDNWSVSEQEQLFFGDQ